MLPCSSCRLIRLQTTQHQHEQILLGRLSVIALRNLNYSLRYTQQLCQPLDEQQERSVQIELLKNRMLAIVFDSTS